MKFAEFKKAGHWPTLLAAFLYFDISFMAWVALGPLIVYIVRDMNLAVDEKFTLVAIPVLAGALLRVPMGLLADLYRRQADRNYRATRRHRRDGMGLLLRPSEQAVGGDLRSRARHRRRLVRGGVAAGQPLVSAAISGRGDGDRRRRQYGRRARHPARADDRRTLGLAGRVRRAARSDGADPRLLRLRGQGCARGAETDFAESLWRVAARSRQPLVHVLLLHHLRRLCRARQCAAAVFHRAVSRIRRGGGPAGFADRRFRLGLPPRRRPDRRPHRRHPLTVDVLWRRRGGLFRHRLHAGRSGRAGAGGLGADPDAADRLDLGVCCSRSACSRSAWAMARCFSSFRCASVTRSA